MLSPARVSATTLSSAHSVSCESTRTAAALLVDWWPTGTTSPPGMKASLGLSTADQWLKWMSKAPSLMGGHFLLSGRHAVPWWGLWQCHCRQMLRGLRKLVPVLTTTHLSPKVRGKVYMACVRSAMIHGPLGYAPHHDPMDLWHHRQMKHLSLTAQETLHWGYYNTPSQLAAGMVWICTACHVLYKICQRPSASRP